MSQSILPFCRWSTVASLFFLASCSSQSSTPARQPAGYPPPQGYPGPYGQPGYGAPPAQPGYGTPPPGYGAPAAQPGYGGGYGQPGGYPPNTRQPPAAPPPARPAPVPQAPPPAPPATGATLPPAPLGSFDQSGSTTAAFMHQEPATVIAELIANLPDASRSKVQGVPLQVIEDPKEVNAFAGCSTAGTAFMGITLPLILIVARASEARAYDELYGTAKYNELANGFASEVRAQKTVTGPSAGFLPLPQALDPRKLARQKFLFDEQVAFVLGHELAHHYRGHTGCANGASSSGITPQDVGRLLSSTVPLFNQPNEIEADVQGTFNVLDTGSRRAAGRYTEEGANMVLDFFSRLESLGVDTIVLGFLMTHPPPQLRLPIVQNAAQQWRNNGGRAPTFPF